LAVQYYVVQGNFRINYLAPDLLTDPSAANLLWGFEKVVVPEAGLSTVL
jgi:hypothetical protein